MSVSASMVKILYAGGGIRCSLKPQSSVYLAIKSALEKVSELTFYVDNKLF